jgi:DtxR family Mn-dependent transcriptional regulator
VDHPLVLIVGAAALVALGAGLAVVLRPGGSWRGLRPARRGRVLLEDALKHLHDVEYRELIASVESLAGALGIGGDRAAGLVAIMEGEGLIERRGTALRLTEDGRTYARRILRIHRLWERWLAEQTGVAETDWHGLAEKREHRMTDEEADALAARLGHPAWDPHGDPIPTAEGELPPPRGVPLPSLSPEAWATVTHLEDEPEALYAELVAADLHPGLPIQLLEASARRVRVSVGGRERELTPVAAANVTVTPWEADADAPIEHEVLFDLAPGETGRVAAILPGCLGAQRRRLLDLGLVPGTQVEAVFASAAGDPVAYRIRGSLIALRETQSRWVGIEREGGEAAADERAGPKGASAGGDVS